MNFELLYVIFIVITVLNYLFLDIKVDKLKKEIIEKDTLLSVFAVLDKSIKKLNEALKSHEKRLDILEEGHPDSDIDYGEVDDDANVIAVWFDGKKYVPEDKRNEDTSKLYADNKVVAETTRPEEKRCCATCEHYRPGPDHTCTIRPWLCTSPARADESSSICNNYKKTEGDCYSATKGEVDYPYIHVPYGNGETDRIMKRVAELQCEIQRLNMIAQFGCTTQELRQRWKELMRNDT